MFTKENTSSIPEPEIVFRGAQSQCLANLQINENMVLKKLSELNVNKSQGSDEIHGKLLQEVKMT